jgi:hypothetical protein
MVPAKAVDESDTASAPNAMIMVIPHFVPVGRL